MKRADVERPIGEVFLPIFGSLRHSPISKCVIRRTEVSLVQMAEEGWKTVQEFLLGRGNMELTIVSSASSDLQCHLGSLPKDRNGTSVILLRFPGMCMVVSGDTFAFHSLSARTRSS